MDEQPSVLQELQNRFGEDIATQQPTRDQAPTLWVDRERVRDVLGYLKKEADRPYRMLYDLSAIDERERTNRQGQPESDFTVVYRLISFGRNEDVCVKVALQGEYPTLHTITDIWPAANWYERETWDMFGITFEGHPHLTRILMPPTWEGHPLRKEHPARATEMGPFQLPVEKQVREEESLRFDPEAWGLQRHGEDVDFLFLNLGPQHPGTHGLLRLVLQLDGENIVDVVPDIGYHHRGAEKMAERQTWHTYIPYTDRVDYLGGVMVKVIRVMLAELFRIASHLVWYGTFAQDVGMMSPVFLTFSDRERIFDIIEAICGARMHPSWFRIGGVAQDLPKGWDRLIREFVAKLPRRLDEYDKVIMRNPIFKARTKGIGAYTTDEAIEWGVTGPGLRATGLEWDFRKKRPYSGYNQFEFEIPTGQHGDCYDRAAVHVEEMRQSLRIIRQCVDHMPAGPYKARHPLTTPPPKEHTMHDIETLIDHFLGVSWGPVIPAGEAFMGIEATKGNNGYYLVSDEDIHAYRVRIRTPSFAHIQMVPLISRGLMVPDVIAILGSIDFVLSDVDR
jgi:NADH-quinone oxidoreductase subunit C/D